MWIKILNPKKINNMAYKFKNLVFEGGGVKGIAYVGALEVLEREKILKNIQRVAGTSAGAMIAVLVGLGYNTEDLRNILWNLDFKEFMDSSWGFIRNTSRLLNDFGWYKGDFFRKLMGNYIKEKTGNSESTFEDIYKLKKEGYPFRDIFLIGSNLSTGFSFSPTNTRQTFVWPMQPESPCPSLCFSLPCAVCVAMFMWTAVC